MSDYGVTPYGFRPKPFEVILAEIEEDFRQKIHPDLNFTQPSVAGQLTGIFASRVRELWELAADVYHSLDPDAAQGRALTSLASLTGTVRKAQESDEALRKRRLLDLRSPGVCTLEALKSKLLALSGVRGVDIRNDDRAHCFTVTALGGEDSALLKTIAQNKPLGIAGTFKRPEVVILNLEIDLVVKSELSSDELLAMKQALVELAQEQLGLGEFVTVSRFYGPLFHFPKVIDVKIAPIVQDIKPYQWVTLEAEHIQIQSVVESV